MKLGIRAHDLGKDTIDNFLLKIEESGFKYLQLVINKAFSDATYEEDYLNKIASFLKMKQIRVSMLGAYFNPVHSKKDVVESGINNFIKNLDIAHLFDTDYVGSETGSYNDSPWIYVPKNRTIEGYNESKKVFLQLLSHARKVGKTILIEPADGHVVYSLEVLEQLLHEIDDDNVKVTLDLYNLLNVDNFSKRDEIFLNGLRTFKDDIKIIHLKDAVIEEGKLIQVAPGRGGFNYPLMIKEIKEYAPNATLIFEGVVNDDITFSKTYIESLIEND